MLCLLTRKNRRPLPFDVSYTIRVLQNNGSKTYLQRVQLHSQYVAHSRKENCFLKMQSHRSLMVSSSWMSGYFLKGSGSCHDRRQLHLGFQKVIILSRMVESLSNPGEVLWKCFLKKLVVSNLVEKKEFNPNKKEDKRMYVYHNLSNLHLA